MANPLITQGVLNRVYTSVIIPSYTNLNVTAPYMAKGFVTVDFEGNMSEQIETGTGLVRSPEPYVPATVTIDLLRSQALAANWLSQAQTDTYLGSMNIHPDTSVYPVISLLDVVIRNVRNGPFDGADPVVRVTARGSFIVNQNMWNFF